MLTGLPLCHSTGRSLRLVWRIKQRKNARPGSCRNFPEVLSLGRNSMDDVGAGIGGLLGAGLSCVCVTLAEEAVR